MHALQLSDPVVRTMSRRKPSPPRLVHPTLGHHPRKSDGPAMWENPGLLSAQTERQHGSRGQGCWRHRSVSRARSRDPIRYHRRAGRAAVLPPRDVGDLPGRHPCQAPAKPDLWIHVRQSQTEFRHCGPAVAEDAQPVADTRAPAARPAIGIRRRAPPADGSLFVWTR